MFFLYFLINRHSIKKIFFKLLVTAKKNLPTPLANLLPSIMKTPLKNYFSNIPEKQTLAHGIKEKIEIVSNTFKNLRQMTQTVASAPNNQPTHPYPSNTLVGKKKLDQLVAKDRIKTKEAQEFLEQLSPDEVRKELRAADEVTEIKKEHSKLLHVLNSYKKERVALQKNIADKFQCATTPIEFKETLKKLDNTIGELSNQINQFASIKSIKPKMLGGPLNVHALDGDDHLGQFAADLPASAGDGGRGKKRAIFNAIESKGTFQFVLVAVIFDHNYKKCAQVLRSQQGK